MFGENFNQPIGPDIIPLSVKNIYFSNKYNNKLNIDLNIKIQCGLKNYQRFLKKKFKHVYFITDHYNVMKIDFATYDDYTVTTKQINIGTKISFKLNTRLVKSSRKI